MEYLTLVNTNNDAIGECEKIEAHQKGLLHRAFSVFLINDQKELLLQQRALNKYHSGGLWSNTCCSHPRPGEELLSASKRRVKEELLISINDLIPLFSFDYKIEFDNGLTEHELDHVLVGRYNQLPKINPSEALNYKWIAFDELVSDLKKSPDKYTFWLNKIISCYGEKLKKGIYENL